MCEKTDGVKQGKRERGRNKRHENAVFLLTLKVSVNSSPRKVVEKSQNSDDGCPCKMWIND